MGFLALMVLFLLEQLGDDPFSIFQANENSFLKVEAISLILRNYLHNLKEKF